ncbi:transposase (fragment) [Bradyrhizobium sp. STM 3843]
MAASRGGRAPIATSRHRKVQHSVDPALYRHRNLIERFFNKLKHFPALQYATMKPSATFLAAALFAATRPGMRF